MRNIYVFYPTQVIGGAELLFVRVLNFLAQHYPIKVGYINFADSCINELLSECVERIVVDKSITLPSHSTIIAPPFCLCKFPKIKSKNIYFLYWVLHFEEFTISMMPLARITREDCAKKAQTMIHYNALICMDEVTKIATEEFSSLKVEQKHIVPVILEDYPCSFTKETLVDEECIHIAWVGRLSRDKIYALINLMDNLEKLDLDKKIKLHIIGEGDSKHLIREYPYEVIYLGTLSPKDLPLYLQKNCDICFAMGTSMLEAEKCGVPAAMVFYTTEKFSNDSFVWTFKLKNYVLGYEKSLGLIPETELMSLEQILNDFLANMAHRSKEARAHFESFLIEKHIEKFLQCANETSYSMEVLSKEKSKIKVERLKCKIIKLFKKLRKVLT
ncbi:glycosyltransferase [Helicobacter sp. MIT 21-1697]|uniref:glycosyltransferase n=1 Tax=Helicobacter sp. MIT 21-1697 TaxID=2993733 RepID=UPI00224A512A|nr:glycosyltransferase [Helicobacter sp. MIT 21-1697]MCX2717903.1 glycosyltransferase [Helicobacter sp. MIT 21-1697]